MNILKILISVTTMLTILTDLRVLEPINKAHTSLQNTTKKQDDSKLTSQKQLVIKFKDELNLPYEDGIEKQIQTEKKDIVLENIFLTYPQLTLTRLFTSVTPKEIDNLKKNKKSFLNTYANLMSYYIVTVPNKMNINMLLEKFKKSSIIDQAYITEKVEPKPPEIQISSASLNPLNNPRFEKQGYLKEAPYGIDAMYAWSINGGDGTGITFADMEYGWFLEHEDLINQKVELLSGLNRTTDFRHGTSVLGIVSAEDNTVGNIGIAPKATPKVISQIRNDGSYNTADAILYAVNKLHSGDVLLLEAQTNYEGYAPTIWFPVELQPGVFDAIRAGIDKGITIIEAGGNGAQDLDHFTDITGKQILNRNCPDFKDSGAIIVGASTSTVPHIRLHPSNYGSRIDVYGWGEDVDTLDIEVVSNLNNSSIPVITSAYTSKFNGTSSASPIIAGAAASIQGIVKANQGIPYSPEKLRRILSNPNTGTQSEDPLIDKIGVLPDLKAIISQLKL